MTKQNYATTQIAGKLAERFGRPVVTYPKIMSLIRDGKLPAEQAANGQYFIDLDDAAEVLGLVDPAAA
jgi:hypothetical protein